jgi:hypothetical protein
MSFSSLEECPLNIRPAMLSYVSVAFLCGKIESRQSLLNDEKFW